MRIRETHTKGNEKGKKKITSGGGEITRLEKGVSLFLNGGHLLLDLGGKRRRIHDFWGGRLW